MDTLDRLPSVRVRHVSTYYETLPIGGPGGQDGFLNSAALLDTSSSPQQLLAHCLQVESIAGRRREERWGARTLDIDLLLYDDLVVTAPELVLPHPRMTFRRFALEPAAEIAGEMVHPPTGWTVAQLLENLGARPLYLALTGGHSAERSSLLQRVSTRTAVDLALDRTPYPRGHNLSRQIEFLDSRADLLEAARRTARQTLLSDFWFDDVLAWDQTEFSHNHWSQLHAHWTEHRPQEMVPNLILMMPAAVDTVAQNDAKRLRDVWKAGVPNQAPSFDLPADLELAADELVAAVQAMQKSD